MQPHATRPLVFRYLDRLIQPGFHVTELKAKKVVGMDCGANTESWPEVTVQLLDADGDESKRMTVGKFLGIATKAMAGTTTDASADLTFEVGRADEAMTLHAYAGLTIRDGHAVVELSPRVALCKPMFRVLTPGQETLPARTCC